MGELNFSDAFQYLVNSGFIDYVVSFILIFTVVFYMLRIIPLFKKHKGANQLISFAIALIFISNQNYVRVVKYIIYDYSTIIITTLLIAMIVSFILYVQANYSKGENEGK